MRSRFSAYALGLVEYVVVTTHPDGPQWRQDLALNVQHFCNTTSFDGLTVHGADHDGDEGHVSFTAHLRRNGRDASFGERSTFYRVDGRWLYHSGEALEQ